MHFPNWFRYLWWILLLIGISTLIYLRWNIISTGQPQTFDSVLLAIGAALVLIPFFSELTVLGVTMKQQAEKAKTDTKEAASSKSMGTPNATAHQDPTAVEAPTDDKSVEIRELETKNSDGLFSNMINALDEGEMEQGEKFFNELQKAESDAIQKLQNEGAYLYLRYVQGDSNALDKLSDLAKRTENSPQANTSILYFLGIAYERSSDFNKAIEAYNLAMSRSDNDKGRAEFIVSISKCLFKIGEKQKAFDEIFEKIEILKDHEALFSLYEGLSDLYKESEQWELRAISLERALAIKANDADVRFAAAYAYSESEFRSLSILHYKSLIQTNPKNTIALNNIGVQYERSNMNITAVSYYKQAVDLKYTLASANIAYQYMNAGFIDEARQILDEARKQQEVHPNIGNAISALSTIDGDEKKKDEQINERARQQQHFMISYANAIFLKLTNVADIAGEWLSNNGYEITITQSDRQIEATWLQNDKKFKLSGSIVNYSLKVTYYRMSYYLTDRELGFTESGKGYIQLSHDLQNANIMIIEDNKDQYIQIRRKTEN